MLPILVSDEDVYPSNSRAEEKLLLILSEFLAVNIHIKLQFNVLSSFDASEELNHGLVIPHFVQLEITTWDSAVASHWVLCLDQFELKF